MISILTKILPNNTTSQYAVISLFFGILIFIGIYLFSNNILLSLYCSVGISGWVYIMSLLREIFGKKRHYSIIESKCFQELRSRGFKVVQVNDYKGLFGSFDGYLFDIYFDWSTYVKHNYHKAIVFNVYFVPPNNGSETDHAKLIELSKKYDVSNWSSKPYNFWWREGNIIMKNGDGFFNPSFKKLTGRMQIVVNILRNENLKPLDAITLTSWRKEFPMSNIPEIELYYKEKTTANSPFGAKPA